MQRYKRTFWIVQNAERLGNGKGPDPPLLASRNVAFHSSILPPHYSLLNNNYTIKQETFIAPKHESIIAIKVESDPTLYTEGSERSP